MTSKKPIVIFDTSAVNQILRCSSPEEVLRSIHSHFSVYVTALNVIEIAKTSDPVLRENLRSVLYRLAANNVVLELPNHLLMRVAEAFQRGDGTFPITLGPQHEQFWVALSEPNSVGKAEQAELFAWARELEESNNSSNTTFSPEVDRVFQAGPESRPLTPVALLRMYMEGKDWQLFYSLPSKVYKHATGRVLPLRRLDAFLEAEPTIWKLYLAAYAFSIYYGAVWKVEHGRRNKVGILDLWCATYLPLCDCFVTHDTKNGGQYDALRLLNAFSSRRPRAYVLTWGQFVKRLELPA